VSTKSGDPKSNDSLIGTVYAASAFSLWGVLTLFWKLFGSIPVFELLAHRIIWSLLFLILVIVFRKKTGRIAAALRDRRTRILLLLSGCAIGLNWFFYIYAMVSDNVVQASLGYYINPLVSIFLGVIVLRERINFWQTISIAFACTGVLVLSIRAGGVPWIALSLSVAFGFYGLIKKILLIDADISLVLEISLLTVYSLVYFIIHALRSSLTFIHLSAGMVLLVIAIGPATIVPLFLFNLGTRRIPLSRVGFLQFITPTMMLALGVFLYKEPFTLIHLVSFIFIWTALGLFAASHTKFFKTRQPKIFKPKV